MGFVRKRCAHCKGKLAEGERIHDYCIAPYAEAQAEKSARKHAKAVKQAVAQDKRETRAKLEKMKTRSEWMKECQTIINKISRIRDRNRGCISCDKPANWHGQWHGSHYRSVGACSSLRFNLLNVHKACSVCNNHLSGNIAAYKPRLEEKIGADRVAWLESQNQLVKHDIDYLKRLKAVMGKKLRRMEKRYGVLPD